jgi:glycerophosphoryl diester phosphodiesterase
MIVSKKWWPEQTEDGVDVLCSLAMELGCAWIDLDALLFSADMVNSIQQRGFQLGLWTVNNLDELRQFAALGLDSLTTDRPDLFAQFL